MCESVGRSNGLITSIDKYFHNSRDDVTKKWLYELKNDCFLGIDTTSEASIDHLKKVLESFSQCPTIYLVTVGLSVKKRFYDIISNWGVIPVVFPIDKHKPAQNEFVRDVFCNRLTL